jgi:hypothetical protein
MSIEEFRAASGETMYDAAVPEVKAQVLMFERDHEIVVAHKLVDQTEEMAAVAAREDALHSERCAQVSHVLRRLLRRPLTAPIPRVAASGVARRA